MSTKVPVWVGLLCLVGGLLVGGVGGTVGGYVAGRVKSPVTVNQVVEKPVDRLVERPAVAQAKPAPPKTRTRDELKQVVMGMGFEWVESELGKPARTSESGQFVTWYYERISHDPVTGKVDQSVAVWFKNGVVTSVVF